MPPFPPYEDRHGGRHLSDEEAQRLGVQPHPEHRRLIYEAAMADEYFTADELEEYARQQRRPV